MLLVDIEGDIVHIDAPPVPGRVPPKMAEACAALKRLPGLRYEIASDPRTDRPALLAMIDVRNLAPGRHDLRIARPPRGDRRPDNDNPDPGFDAIAFWR